MVEDRLRPAGCEEYCDIWNAHPTAQAIDTSHRLHCTGLQAGGLLERYLSICCTLVPQPAPFHHPPMLPPWLRGGGEDVILHQSLFASSGMHRRRLRQGEMWDAAVVRYQSHRERAEFSRFPTPSAAGRAGGTSTLYAASRYDIRSFADGYALLHSASTGKRRKERKRRLMR